MKQCQRCGTAWTGYNQPTSRQVCEGCGIYLHSCVNCHHFDSQVSNSCRLTTTFYVGPRDAPNYCEEFRMVDSRQKARETKVERARATWEDLFRT